MNYIKILHDYQKQAINFILRNPRCGIFLDMGLGKTAITLHALERLTYDRCEMRKTLILAPLRVANNNWHTEAAAWTRTSGMRVNICTGSKKRREQALNDPNFDIYVLNHENVHWLENAIKTGEVATEFEYLVIDELSCYKSQSSQRTKSLTRMAREFKRVIGLTGTPAPNGLMNLFSQLKILDGGRRLYPTITAFRDKWFTPGKRKGHIVYEWVPVDNAQEQIFDRISDICFGLNSTSKVTLPSLVTRDLKVTLPTKVATRYEFFKKENVYYPEKGIPVIAESAGVLVNRLLQFTGGHLYTDIKETLHIHDEKLNALGELIEHLNGKPLVVFYNYTHERDSILKRFGGLVMTNDNVFLWNSGKIPLYLINPRSGGHGLNLQEGGCHFVWYSLTYDLEIYQQANARLYRQGQKNTTFFYRIIAENTIDEQVVEVLEKKATLQDALLKHIERG